MFYALIKGSQDQVKKQDWAGSRCVSPVARFERLEEHQHLVNATSTSHTHWGGLIWGLPHLQKLILILNLPSQMTFCAFPVFKCHNPVST